MIVKKLAVSDIQVFKAEVTQYIFESMSSGAYMSKVSESDAAIKAQELEKYIEENRALVFGAIIDNVLVGFIWGYEYPFREDASRVYVSILHVHADYRGKQIGQKLLSALESEALSLGYRSVYLHTEGSNRRALNFYQRMGYVSERIQLVKQASFGAKPVVGIKDAGGGVRLLTSKMVDDHKEILSTLFYLNTKAHILTTCYDYYWAKGKIDELVTYVANKKAIVAGYYLKENLVGFIWIYPIENSSENRFVLNAIVVFQEYRQMDIASQLFAFAEGMVFEKDGVLQTNVDTENYRAHRFYVKHGMAEDKNQLVKFFPGKSSRNNPLGDGVDKNGF